MRLSFNEMKVEIAKIVPDGIKYEVSLEAGDISIITPSPELFGGGEGLIGKIAKTIKRRIVLRPDASIMLPEDQAETYIRDLLEEKAGIKMIYFDACFCEVTVICENPSEAVGRRGENVKAIRDECGWLVKFERTPPIHSKTVHDIRGYRSSNSKERRKLLSAGGISREKSKKGSKFSDRRNYPGGSESKKRW